MNRLCETQHRRCDDGEQTALEEERRMRSELEIPSLGRKGLRGMVCVVWCVERGKGREGEGKGEERRREGKHLYPSLSIHLLPINSPAGPTPRGTPVGHHTLSTHSTPYPTQPTQAQKWGIPTSSPPGEREEKEGEKGTLQSYYPQFFSLGENPQTPPFYWDAQEKRQERRGRALC